MTPKEQSQSQISLSNSYNYYFGPSTFSSFLMSAVPNAWVQAHECSTLMLYVRRSHHTHMGDIQIANMTNTKPGKGELTKFLDTWEPHVKFYFENVINPRLGKFLEKRGYKITPMSKLWSPDHSPGIAPCYIRPLPPPYCRHKLEKDQPCKTKGYCPLEHACNE